MKKEPLISIALFESLPKESQQQCVDAMNYLAGTLKHSHPDLFAELDGLQTKITRRLELEE